MNNSGKNSPAVRRRGVRQYFRKFGGSVPRDREDLYRVLQLARERGIIQHGLYGVMQRAVFAGDKQVREIMIPRPAMQVVRITDPVARWVETIVESEHSRYPAIGASADEVLGILLAKDLLPLLSSHKGIVGEEQRRKLLRPAYFVPESKELHTLLTEFRRQRTHMAIVKDEYGGTAGLLTLEDALEEIIGDIEDEHDSEQKQHIRVLDAQNYHLDALTPLEEFDEAFATSLQDQGYADTLSGVLSRKLGRIPRVGDALDLEDMKITVIEADARRAHLLHLRRKTTTPADDSRPPED